MVWGVTNLSPYALQHTGMQTASVGNCLLVFAGLCSGPRRLRGGKPLRLHQPRLLTLTRAPMSRLARCPRRFPSRRYHCPHHHRHRRRSRQNSVFVAGVTVSHLERVGSITGVNGHGHRCRSACWRRLSIGVVPGTETDLRFCTWELSRDDR